MKKKTRSVLIRSSPDRVFAYMDNISNTGMHMMKSSMMMMGSKLKLEQLTEQVSGLGAKYRWFGKMLGFTLDFTVEVTKWVQDKEKVWETVGGTKLIILSWYRMWLVLTPHNENTIAELGIEYTTPTKFFYRILALLLAPWYANWCLKNMLGDSKRNLEPAV